VDEELCTGCSRIQRRPCRAIITHRWMKSCAPAGG
jgi:hypothetical protein